MNRWVARIIGWVAPIPHHESGAAKRVTLFLSPEHLAKVDSLRRPKESRGQLIERLLNRIPDSEIQPAPKPMVIKAPPPRVSSREVEPRFKKPR